MIILTVPSDTTIFPIIAVASFTSFLLTGNIGLLKTQRARSTSTISGLSTTDDPEVPV